MKVFQNLIRYSVLSQKYQYFDFVVSFEDLMLIMVQSSDIC